MTTAPSAEHPVLPRLPRLPGWHLHARPDLLVLTTRPGTGGVRPQIRVELESLGGRDEPPDLGSWRAVELFALRRHGHGFEVEDEDCFLLHDREVHYCRYAVLERHHDLVGEEWAWELPGLGAVVSWQLHRADYLRLCDVVEDLADLVVDRLGRE